MTEALSVTWMLAAALLALLVAAAAHAAEAVGSAHPRFPLRGIWVVALVGATLLPTQWIGPGTAAPITDRTAAQPPRVSPSSAAVNGGAPAFVMPTPDPTRQRALSWRWPRVPMAVERGARLAWAGASGLAALLVAWSLIRLSGERRRWRERTVDGVAVLEAPDLGPAIVGLRAPAIVLPPWVFALSGAEQRLIVLHEHEHRDARDPWLLVTSLLALVLMPWNPGIWIIRRRLQRAIELDCDARVLARGVDAATYAQLLLGAWHRARSVRYWGLVPALAERASGLGRRVEHLMRPAPRRRLMTTSVGTLLAALLLGATQFVPTPERVVPRGAVATAADTLGTQPPRRVRLLVDAPSDSIGRALAERIGAALGADSAGRPVYVIPGSDREATLRAGGFDPSLPLSTKDTEGLLRLLRADVVVRVETEVTGARVALSIGIPTAVPGDFRLRPLVTVTGGPNAIARMSPQPFVTAVRLDTGFTRLRTSSPREAPVVIRLTSVGRTVPAGAQREPEAPDLLLYTTGNAMVGLGTGALRPVRDTLRLSALPALTADVTDGEVHLHLIGPGTIRVEGTVTNGPALRVGATGRHLVLPRGGVGIENRR